MILASLVKPVIRCSRTLQPSNIRQPYRIDGLQRGLALVQLKRALRGVAFARGALYPLRMEGRLSESDFEELQATLKQLDEGIFEQLSRIRDERASGW